jgi:aspartate racemase
LRLAQAGADFIVIPCNTAHAFLPRIEAEVPVPILSMVEATALAIARDLPGVRVGILSTAGTIAANLYQAAFERHGLESQVPSPDGQARVARVIADVKAGKVGAEQTSQVSATASELIRAGAGALVTACTELPLVLSQGDVSVPLFDPTQVLAEAAVARALGQFAAKVETAGRSQRG